MISVIMAPADKPQVGFLPRVAAPAPELDATDRRIVDAVRECEPVHVWNLLGFLTADTGDRDRTAGRTARLDLWHRIRKLKKRGVLIGIGRSGVTTDLTHRRNSPRRLTSRRPTVANPNPRNDVSGPTSEDQPPSGKRLYPPATELAGPHSVEDRLQPQVTKPKSAPDTPTAAELTSAARNLASLPRNQPKQWTGWIDGQRYWRGRLVRTPFGDILPLMMSNRGRVMLSHPDFETLPITELRNRTIWKAEQLQLAKNPAAVALGKAKLGIKERPSTIKQATARANGLRPCRPGRMRGRPRTNRQQTSGSAA